MFPTIEASNFVQKFHSIQNKNKSPKVSQITQLHGTKITTKNQLSTSNYNQINGKVTYKSSKNTRPIIKGSANLCRKFKARTQFEGMVFNLIRGGFHGLKGKLCPIKVSGI
jgi:hypothetical protein